eukprot:TRINITY_DN13300_c0_g1_i3.p1 TRINITY_DN13300_c0_g1~~TRINITY_DN13300_c0_g1_i3.p1  ORF type:complete len:665 (+),score=94.32 TRINITY_DN13300_c0_g1_i3:43-2037(+)
MARAELDADVIIVGLGPVGNFAAHLLAAFGVQQILAFEAGPEKPYFAPRAVTWDAATLQAGRTAGGPDLEQYMRWQVESLRRIDHHQDNYALFKVGTPPNFSKLLSPKMKDMDAVREKNMAGSKYPFGDFHQPLWEMELRRRLALRSEVKIAYDSPVTDVRLVDGICQVTVAPLGGNDTKVYSARYCLASDGGASKIRKSLGIDYVGETFSTWRCLVIDTEVHDEAYLRESWIGQEQTGFFANPDSTFVIVRTPAFFASWWEQATAAAKQAQSEEEAYRLKEETMIKLVTPFVTGQASSPIPKGVGIRFEFSILDGADREQAESDAYVQKMLNDINVDPERLKIVRKCHYVHHARQATRWRKGPLLLIGDAAHCMPPYGGQGLNAGLGDALNIAWKLALVLKGKADDSLLNSYEPERRIHVEEVTKLSVNLGAMLEVRSSAKCFLRNTFFRLLQMLVPIHETLGSTDPPAIRSPQGAWAPLGTHKFAGIRFPCPILEYEGRLVRIDHVMAANGFSLILPGPCSHRASETSLRLLQDIGTTVVTVEIQGGGLCDAAALETALPVRLCKDVQGRFSEFVKNEQLEGKVFVVRPDKYIFGVFDDLDEGIALLQDALLGHQTATREVPSQQNRRTSPRSQGLAVVGALVVVLFSVCFAAARGRRAKAD